MSQNGITSFSAPLPEPSNLAKTQTFRGGSPVPLPEITPHDSELLEFLVRLAADGGQVFPESHLNTRNIAKTESGSSLSNARPTPNGRAALPGSIGRFQIQGVLGAGGFGIVLRAYDPELERDVAIKVLRPERTFSPDIRDRFLREARAAAGLEHPAIISPHEIGSAGKVVFLASPLCEGPTLAAWLIDNPQGLPMREAAKLMAGVADAVHHAHFRGIVHRDLKPSNILLEPAPEEGSDFPFLPKLTDFGLAKRMDDDQGATMTGIMQGTSAYMSPEQAAGKWKEVGVGSDVFALGIILYEVLTGKRPYVGQSPEETRRMIMESDPPSPRKEKPNLPKDLETICLKCMSAEMADRYSSAAAVALDLRNYLHRLPLVGCPPGIVRRIELWCRRRPVVASLLGIIAILVVVSFGAVGVALRQTFNLQHEQEQKRLIARPAGLRMLRDAREFAKQPGSQRKQKESLEEALLIFDLLFKDDPDEQARNELQQALHDLGNIVNMLGEIDPLSGERKSLQYHLRCVQVLDTLVRDFPNNVDYQYAKFHNLLVAAGEAGENRKLARSCFEQAEKIIRRLIAEHSDEPTYEEALTSLCDNWAMSYLAINDVQQALAKWEEARQISRRLVKNYPEKLLFAKNGAAALAGMGGQEAYRGNWDAAIAYFEEGEAIIQKLKERAAAAPADDHRWTVDRWVENTELRVKLDYAMALLYRSKKADARATDRDKIMRLLGECRRTCDTLITWFPDTTGYYGNRANVNFQIGKLHEQNQDVESAIKAYELAMEDRKAILASPQPSEMADVFRQAEARLKTLRK